VSTPNSTSPAPVPEPVVNGRVNNTSKRASFLQRILRARETGIALVVILIMIGLSLATPNFFTPENLAIVARVIALSAIYAMGETMVILLGGIDLSVGSVGALTGVVTVFVMVTMQMPIWVGILAGLMVGAVVGFLNGILIIKTKVAPFIITLGMMGLARGIALVLTKGSALSGLPGAFLQLGQGFIFTYIPIPVAIAVVLALGLHIFLSRTTMGRRIYFTGSNEDAAVLSGINVNKIKVIVFTACAALAAWEAIIETARLSTAMPSFGTGYELTAIGAVIIGGASLMGGEGTVLGTILGATLLGLISNGLILLGISTYWQQVFSGGIIIMAVALDTWRRRRS